MVFIGIDSQGIALRDLPHLSLQAEAAAARERLIKVPEGLYDFETARRLAE